MEKIGFDIPILFEISNRMWFTLEITFFPKWDISIMFWWVLTGKLAIINYSMERMLSPIPHYSLKEKQKESTLDSSLQWIYMKKKKSCPHWSIMAEPSGHSQI